MATLSSRFKEFNAARRSLLDTLSHARPGVPDATQLTDTLSEDWLDASYPMAPLLACDFLIEYQPAVGADATLSSKDWLLDGLDFGPAELSWKYENSPIAWPTPGVGSGNCSITFLVPTGIGITGALSGSQWYKELLNLYNEQFSSRGLLKASGLSRSFTVSAIASVTQKNFTHKEEYVPLMRLGGLRFGTPKVAKFDPKSMEPLAITLPFVHTTSAFFTFDPTTQDATLNTQIEGLSSVFQSDQFNNR